MRRQGVSDKASEAGCREIGLGICSIETATVGSNTEVVVGVRSKAGNGLVRAGCHRQYGPFGSGVGFVFDSGATIRTIVAFVPRGNCRNGTCGNIEVLDSGTLRSCDAADLQSETIIDYRTVRVEMQCDRT